MRILIADDHAVVRRGLKQILADDFKNADFGEASNTREALERSARNTGMRPCRCHHAGRSGLEALREIKKPGPDWPVLGPSMHAEDHFASASSNPAPPGLYDQGMRAGRNWWAPSKIVLAGGRYVAPRSPKRMASLLPRPPHGGCPTGEFGVLRQMLGQNRQPIAEELSLSVKNREHLSHAHPRKMGMTSNAELNPTTPS